MTKRRETFNEIVARLDAEGVNGLLISLRVTNPRPAHRRRGTQTRPIA